MSIIGTIIIGFLAGLVASFLMPGRDPAGFIIPILLGIGGAFLASWLGREFGWYREGQSAEFIGAVVGSIIILIMSRIFVGRVEAAARARIWPAVR